MRFGVSIDIKRIMIELFLMLPYHRMMKNGITHIPPWAVFLTLSNQGDYTVMCFLYLFYQL